MPLTSSTVTVGRYPDSLDELVGRDYLRSLPFDPITDSATTWLLVPPDERFLGNVYNIKSGATSINRDGRPYEGL
jgi:general secretion pathway protein G